MVLENCPPDNADVILTGSVSWQRTHRAGRSVNVKLVRALAMCGLPCHHSSCQSSSTVRSCPIFQSNSTSVMAASRAGLRAPSQRSPLCLASCDARPVGEGHWASMTLHSR
jgi:hypothetical protein